MTHPYDSMLLISDIDGTFITEQGYLPERNLQAARDFMDRGGRFAFATGRSVLGTAPYADKAAVNTPCIVCNGGGIYDFAEQKMLWSRPMPAHYGEVIDLIRVRFPDVGIEIYAGSAVYYANKNAFTTEHTTRQGIVAEDCPGGVYPKQANKILFCADRPRLLEVSAFVDTLENGGWEPVFSSPFFYELLPQGISKGAAIDVLADMLGIATDNVACIGDYYNDLEMLMTCPISAAPAEAPEEIRRVAKITVGPCESGAVADLIAYLERKRARHIG
jgi:Cof subfamily protein (haloacid dehalogenase superfamily)